MKKNNPILILVLFLCVAISATASFSGKYLSVRKGGVTYKHRLYTTQDEAGGSRLAVRVGGATRYAGLQLKGSVAAIDGSATVRLRRAGSNTFIRPVCHYQVSSAVTTANDSSCYFDINSGGQIYVSVPSAQQIRVYNTSYSQIATWTLGYTPGDICIDGSDNVFVGNGASYVYKYTSTGTYQGNYNHSFSTQAVFRNGYFYYLAGGRIYKVTTSFSLSSTSAQFSGITSFAVDGSDNVYWTTGTKIYKSSWSGTLLAEAPYTYSNLDYLEFSQDTDQLWASKSDETYGYVLNTSLGGLGYWGYSSIGYRTLRIRNGALYSSSWNGSRVQFSLFSY